MALGDVIARLSVQLGLDSAAFEKGSRKAGAQADAMGDRMEKMGRRVGTAIRGIAAAGVGLAGAFLVSQVKQMATAGLQHASSLGEQATQLGVTTSALQRYRYIATQVGISQDEMDKGLTKLSLTLGKLSVGSEEQRAKLEKFGFTTAETAKLAKLSAEDALPFLADKYKALTSETERAALVAEIFGARMGGKFKTLLEGGAAGINTLADAYKRLGIEISPEQIAKADEAADKLAALQQVLAARQAQVAADSSDVILKGTEAWEGFKIKVLQVAGNLSGAWDSMEKDTTSFSDAIKRIDKQLGIPSPSEFTDYIARNFSESAARVRDFFVGLYKFTTEAPGNVVRMVSAIGAAITGKLSAIWEGAKAKIEQVRQSFFNLWDLVTRRSYVPDMVDDIAREMARLDAVMVNPAKTAAERTKQVFEKLGNDVRGIMDNLFPEARAAAEAANQRAALEKGIAAGGAGGFTAPQLQAGLDRMDEKAIDGAIAGLKGLFDLADVGLKSVDAVAANVTGTVAGGLSAALEGTKEKFTELQEFGGRAFGVVTDGIKGVLLGFQNLGDAIRDVVSRLADMALDWAFSALGKSIGIPGYATGTASAPRGLAWVGERGPELVNFRGGERVYNNRDSERMAGGARSVSVTYNDYSQGGRRASAGQIARETTRQLNGPMRGVS